jgi:type IV pilus assembly protein PilB
MCVLPYTPDEVTLTLLGLTRMDLVGATPMRGTGCPECGGTGYRGRTAVYEVVDVDAAMRQVLMKEPTEAAISAQARATGVVSLRAAALEKARRGHTTFEEVVRVTHADSTGGNHCPACERSVGADMVVCPWCATPIDQGNCSSCARHLEPQWRVCPWCRTPAAGSVAPGPGPGTWAPGAHPAPGAPGGAPHGAGG